MKKLIDLLPGRISTRPEDLVCYGFDASGLEGLPAAVVWPKDTNDVVTIMSYAEEHDIAVIPRGAGTGMTGGSVPSQGAVVISMERMNRVLDLDRENMQVLIEPGVINGRLQRELELADLFYPPDPSSMNFCTIGGNVAENAGGPRAVKYGVTRDYVMALEAVLPGGAVITTGVNTAKGVVGYDLTSLLVGSEGTLAVVTKIRLRTLPLPEDVITLLVIFGSVEQAGSAVTRITSKGIVPRTIEFMDGETIRAVESYRPVGFPQNAEALLLIELDGSPSAIKKDAEKIADICVKLGGELIMAENDVAREKIWEARRAVSPALYHLMPGKINEDIVVPRTKIPEMLVTLQRLSERTGIRIVNFGHAGDGNIHVNLMIDRQDGDQLKKALGLVEEIFRATLDLGGTISGEHGVGLTKLPYIKMEIGEAEMRLMKKIKGLFDPKNILNPGKIFP